MHTILYPMSSACYTPCYIFPVLYCTEHNAEDTAYLGVHPLGPRVAVLYSPVEVHGQHELRAGLLPGVSMPEPVVCLFHLQEGYG